jgi:hypothetical protein
MSFVIDTSIAACWLMPDEHHPIADAAQRRIIHEPAMTPVLWWYELRNIMLVNERRGRLDKAKTDRLQEGIGLRRMTPPIWNWPYAKGIRWRRLMRSSRLLHVQKRSH